jgi:soluble lytic murein transglycosylase-like protein
MLILLLLGQILSTTKTGNVLFTNIRVIEGTNKHKTELVCTDYDHIIKHYCQVYDIDAELVKIIIQNESEFNPRAVSSSGAIGLMQLMPETARGLGVKDPYNPRENIKGGVKYLNYLSRIFQDDLELVLAGYHAGPGLVRRLNRVPNIPATLEYVDHVLSRYGRGRRKSSVYVSITTDGTLLFTNVPK